MIEISDAVKEGAQAFLAREYKTVAIVAVVMFVLLFVSLGMWTALGFIIGTAGSAFAGYFGMVVCVMSNVRTAEAAKKGLGPALSVAFKAVLSPGLWSLASPCSASPFLYGCQSFS